MPEDRQIPTSAPSDKPTFRIISEGNQVSETFQVLSIVVTKQVNRISAAQIFFKDGDPAQEDFPISNSDDFIPGKKIEVHAGYHSDEEVIFKGIVVKNSVRARKDQASVFQVECRDEAVKLTVGRKSKYFYESKDSEIIEEIVSGVGIDKEVDPTTFVHQTMVQFQSTDWDFIVSRADASGKLVFTDDNKLLVKKPGLDQSPVLSLRYGGNIIAFETEMDARDQFASVKAKSWDSSNQEMIESESETFSGILPGNIDTDELSGIIGLADFSLSHGGGKKDVELQDWANAQGSKSKLSKIRGRIQIQGFSNIKPGNMVELNGMGDRFNGSAFVSSVRHDINAENWITNIGVGLQRTWFTEEVDGINDMEAAGMLPAINGLQVGIVTALEGDPDGEFRVQVRMPLIDESEGVWARVALLDAGDNRGSFFRPEIGDEVVLGFFNDDPRDPVILGMLNSSAKPAPITPADDNHEKGFITRSEMKLMFDDDKKVIQIETPNGNIMKFSDDEGKVEIVDENGNKMTMDSSGILMETNSDINIKSSGDISIEGTNINLKANANFKAEGNAGAELSSGATAILKGSIVQIN
jgi:Rhs element Vgr protein